MQAAVTVFPARESNTDVNGRGDVAGRDRTNQATPHEGPVRPTGSVLRGNFGAIPDSEELGSGSLMWPSRIRAVAQKDCICTSPFGRGRMGLAWGGDRVSCTREFRVSAVTQRALGSSRHSGEMGTARGLGGETHCGEIAEYHNSGDNQKVGSALAVCDSRRELSDLRTIGRGSQPGKLD
ncbi:hypothetical protein VUR80DRAFT_1306 [Thermomyces stellatus]